MADPKNVVKINIEAINCNKPNGTGVSEIIGDIYYNTMAYRAHRSYNQMLEADWGNLSGGIQSLYNVKTLIAKSTTRGHSYFIFDTNASQASDKITLEVLILVANSDLSGALNVVISDMKNKVKSQGCKVNVLIKNTVYIYPCVDNDIMNLNCRIKANFDTVYSKFSKIDIIRGSIVLLITIGYSGYLLFAADISDLVKNVGYSLVASGIFYLFTEIWIKFPSRYSVSIKTWADFLETDTISPDVTSCGDTEIYNSPEVGV